MPSNWLSFDSDFPSFTGKETPEQQIQALHNYLYQLREGLQYSLQNLTDKNFNAAALQSLTDAQKNEVTTQLEKVYALLNQASTEIDNLSSRVSGVENLSGRVTAAESEITALKGRTTLTEGSINDLANRTATAEADIKATKSKATITEENVAALADSVTKLQDVIQKISGSIQVADDGSTTVGAEGKPLYLSGQIYINGVLIEQGGTT